MSSKKTKEITAKDKLIALYKLQTIDSNIDEIKRHRGELPLKLQDLEDEIAGLKTRQENIQSEIKTLTTKISEKKNAIKDAEALIKKYTKQQQNVRNNREYDSLTKEIEFQTLDIQLSEKRIKEYKVIVKEKEEPNKETKTIIKEKKTDLDETKLELEKIISETEKDVDKLTKKSEKIEVVVEERLLKAYKRIRDNVRNGLSVVVVERDACGGCFNKIPPQRQLDVASNKKIIVCEFCGRILVDREIVEIVKESMPKNSKR